MIDKREGTNRKPVKQQDYFRQSHPDRMPKGETGKSGGKKGK